MQNVSQMLSEGAPPPHMQTSQATENNGALEQKLNKYAYHIYIFGFSYWITNEIVLDAPME